MTKKTRKAIILARISTIDQAEGHSIDAQKKRLIEYCDRNELNIIKIFELIESSTIGVRKKYKEMLKFAISQGETVAIVTDKVDRLQRSFSDTPLLDEYVRKGKVELHFHIENCVIHKSSRSQERMIWNMHVMMAQSYVDSIRDNVTRSLEHKLQNGEWIGAAPLGYLNARDQKGNSIVVIDPKRADIIRHLFEEYATGTYTLGDLLKKAKDLGLKSKQGHYLKKSTLHRIIQNSFYYGEMRVKGELYPHYYEPIIPKAIYIACKEVRNGWSKKRFQYSGKNYIFRGIIKCATTGRISTADTKTKTYKNGKTARWTYLRVWRPENPSKQLWVREDHVLERIANTIQTIEKINPEECQKIKKLVSKKHHLEKAYYNKELKSLKSQVRGINDKNDTLLDLLTEGILSKEEFKERNQRIKHKQEKIKKAIKHFENEIFIRINDPINVEQSLFGIFKNSNNTIKRQIINYIFDNLRLKGRELEYDIRMPFRRVGNVGYY